MAEVDVGTPYSMFDLDQKLRDRLSVADAGIDLVRTTLFPEAHDITSEQIGAFLPKRVCFGRTDLPNSETSARDFAHANSVLSGLIAATISGPVSLDDKYALAAELGRSAFTDKPQAAELLASIVMHKLEGDLSRPGGVQLVASKFEALLGLVGAERFQAAFGPFSKEVTQARALIAGRLESPGEYILSRIDSGVSATLFSIGTDSNVEDLFKALEPTLADLRLRGIVDIGLPLGEVSLGSHCGYFQSFQLMEELKEIAQILRQAGFNTFSTYVTEPDRRRLNQSIADDLLRRINDLGPDKKFIAFVEPDQIQESCLDTRPSHNFKPLLSLLSDSLPRDSITTIRWVGRSETLAGFSTNGRGAARGVQATDLLALKQGEFCVVKNEAGNDSLRRLLRHYMGCETDAVLLEG